MLKLRFLDAVESDGKGRGRGDSLRIYVNCEYYEQVDLA